VGQTCLSCTITHTMGSCQGLVHLARRPDINRSVSRIRTVLKRRTLRLGGSSPFLQFTGFKLCTVEREGDRQGTCCASPLICLSSPPLCRPRRPVPMLVAVGLGGPGSAVATAYA